MRCAFLLCVVAVAVTACGGTEKPANERKVEVNPNVLAKAFARTTAAGTSKVALETEKEITFESNGDKKTQALSSEATGAFDFQRLQGTMTASFSGEAAGFLGNDSSQFVFASTVTYWRAPPGPEPVSLPAGKSWVRFDTEKLSGEIGFSPVSPLETLRLLSAATDIFRSGADLVRGVDTTRYTTTIEVTPRSPMDVWIDEEGLIRRQRYEQQYEGAGGAHIEMTVTMDLYDFGAPVTVNPPPADEVVDARDLIARESG